MTVRELLKDVQPEMLQVPRAPFDELLPDLQRGLSGSGTFFVYT